MKSVWFKPEHSNDPEKKKNYETTILNSRVIVERLLEILQGQEENLDRYEDDLANYTGDWAAKQAFLNGSRSHIRTMRSLLNFR